MESTAPESTNQVSLEVVAMHGTDSALATSVQNQIEKNLLEKHIVPYFASNLRLDNAFINDTNIFCPRCLRREMFRVRFYIF